MRITVRAKEKVPKQLDCLDTGEETSEVSQDLLFQLLDALGSTTNLRYCIITEIERKQTNKSRKFLKFLVVFKRSGNCALLSYESTKTI